MTTMHDLLIKMDIARVSPIDETEAPSAVEEPHPPPVTRRPRLQEKRAPPTTATPKWRNGERYAADFAELLGGERG